MNLIGLKKGSQSGIEKKRKGKKTRVRLIGQERQTIKSVNERVLNFKEIPGFDRNWVKKI